MNKIYTKSALALAAFLVLGLTISLGFKENATLSSNFFRQNAAGAQNSSFSMTYVVPEGRANLDLKAASKETGMSPGEIASFAKKINGGMVGGCIGNIGSVTVSHSVCTPPGPGRCTGDSKKPGKDFCPCPVSGTQGGSVTAICYQGCCRAISATAPGGALSGMSPSQQSLLGILGQGLQQFLGQMMQGGGGDGGYSYPDYGYGENNYESVTDTDLPSVTQVSEEETSFDYLNPNIETEANIGTEVSVISEQSGTETTQAQDLIETVLLEQKKEKINQAQDPGTAKQETSIKIETEPVPQVTEIDEINKSEIYNYEFQNIENKKKDDPRLAELRDPDKSKVASLRYQNKDTELDYLPDPEEIQKSWWQKLLDWILGN